MATTQQAESEAAIVKVARSLGLDPVLALAAAETESEFNPQAVGDNGTSFGLFQLHQGGELDSLKGSLAEQKKQAFDPETNARVALAEFQKVVKAHPDWTPGQVAAAAQRPADSAGYAVKVNQFYQELTNAHTVNNIDVYTKAKENSADANAEANSIKNQILNSDAAGTVAGALNPFGDLEKQIMSVSFWTRIAFILGGFIILFIGVSKLTGVNVTGDVEKAAA